MKFEEEVIQVVGVWVNNIFVGLFVYWIILVIIIILVWLGTAQWRPYFVDQIMSWIDSTVQLGGDDDNGDLVP